MTIVEFVGFIISLLAILLIMLRRNWEDRQRKNYPERYRDETEQEDALRDFLKSLEIDMEEGKELSKQHRTALPPLPNVEEELVEEEVEKPHRTVSDTFKFQTRLDRYKAESAIETRALPLEITAGRFEKFAGEQVVSQDLKGYQPENAYELIEKVEICRARKLIDNLSSLQDMVVLREILDSPKGIR